MYSFAKQIIICISRIPTFFSTNRLLHHCQMEFFREEPFFDKEP